MMFCISDKDWEIVGLVYLNFEKDHFDFQQSGF